MNIVIKNSTGEELTINNVQLDGQNLTVEVASAAEPRVANNKYFSTTLQLSAIAGAWACATGLNVIQQPGELQGYTSYFTKASLLLALFAVLTKHFDFMDYKHSISSFILYKVLEAAATIISENLIEDFFTKWLRVEESIFA